jgi:hypothetical protein
MRPIVNIFVSASLVLAAAGMASAQSSSGRSQLPTEPGWPTKAGFLEATRQGQFNDIPSFRPLSGDAERQMMPFLLSVKAILIKEYGVPDFPDWPGRCQFEFVNGVARIFQDLTAANLSYLSDKPPDFTNRNHRDISAQLRQEITQIQRPGSYCDTQVNGQWQAHPYKAALPRLMGEYGRSLSEWITNERDRRRTAYSSEQAQIQADEQRRIDAEREKADAQQKRQQQINKGRVAG